MSAPGTATQGPSPPTSPSKAKGAKISIPAVLAFPDSFLMSPPISGRPPLHSSIATLTCITPLANSSVNGSELALSIPSDVLAVGELLSTMKLTLNALGMTFNSLGEQTAKVVHLGPTLEMSHQVKILRAQMAEQYARQEQQMREVKSNLRDVLKKQLADHVRTSAEQIIQSAVEREVKNRVREQLNSQIPISLRQQVKTHKRQILEIQTSLHNSEARRHNALLRSSLTEPLRPLLRPFPIQSPSPAPSTLLKPTITVSPPNTSPFSPTVPSPPLPTPTTHDRSDSDGEETPTGPPTPSPLFPRDLVSLFALGQDAARTLVQEYGLVGDADKSRQPSPLDEKQPLFAIGEDSRETNLNLFMAHIGVPFKMVPMPGSPMSPLVTAI